MGQPALQLYCVLYFFPLVYKLHGKQPTYFLTLVCNITWCCFPYIHQKGMTEPSLCLCENSLALLNAPAIKIRWGGALKWVLYKFASWLHWACL